MKTQCAGLTMGIVLGCVVCSTFAVPPPPPKKENLVMEADVIAVITITSIKEEKAKESVSEAASFRVEQVIKGVLTSDEKLSNRYSTIFPHCVGGWPLPKDKSLIFLRRRNGSLFVSDYYGTWLIKDGKLNSWLPDDPLHQKWPQDVPLSDVVNEIKMIIDSAARTSRP